MTGSEIIAKFELKVDDQSLLSSDESLDLLNKIYRKVIDYRPWEWLKKEGSGTVSSNEVTVPSDFKYFVDNYEDFEGNRKAVVFVGPNNQVYDVIPFSQRRNYRDQDGYVYYDARQNKIVFTSTNANGKSVEYDYIYQPSDLTTQTSPVFPERFHEIIPSGMALEFASMDNTPKSRSYAEEFGTEYDELLTDMSYENSKLYGGSSY